MVEIVISGLAHSGKTTSVSVVQQRLQELGHSVLMVPDAVELLGLPNNLDVQELARKNERLVIQLVRTQNELRKQWQQLAVALNNEKTVLLHRRTVIDFAPFITDFDALLLRAGVTAADAKNSFETVIHLVGNSQNPVEQKLLETWNGVPHLRVVDIEQTELFEDKIKQVWAAVARTTGSPPREIEHKYLLTERPEPETLLEHGAVAIEIEQTYLLSPDPDIEVRVRKRTHGAQSTYYYTQKKVITELIREETDRIITYREYNELLLHRDPARGTIKKTRYCLIENNYYLEVDLFHNPSGLALLEVEVDLDTEEVMLPDHWKVEREVSSEPEWSNFEIAAKVDRERL